VDALSLPLRRRVRRGEGAFYSEWVSAVATPSDRERIVEGAPCCIVASSGMLSGGASTVYARALASDDRNLIAITGYQDEESPGRALLSLARTGGPSERVLTLNGQRTHVACRVETYSLSAHADGGELAALARGLSPRTAYVVHGELQARASLASALDSALEGGAVLPESGTEYEATSGAVSTRGRRYGRTAPIHGISRGRPVSADALREVRTYLDETGRRGPYRAQELAEVWHGTDGLELAQVEALKCLLDAPASGFEPDRRRPFLYRASSEAQEPSGGPMEMNAARERIQAAIPPEAGLVKCSAHVEEGAYELAFHFPDVASVAFADSIGALEEETGWKIRVRNTPHQGRLFEEALSVVPDGATALKTPALHLESREVTVPVAVPEALGTAWEDLSAKAAARFERVTGFRLLLVCPDAQEPDLPPSPPAEAWEINQAYAEIREAFGSRPHAPYRTGLKSWEGASSIELAFISPEVGERYGELLSELSSRVGWPIHIRGSANQEAIAQEARRVTPEGCAQSAAPRLFPAESRVVVPVVTAPSESEAEALQETFLEATGFRILWETTRV